MMYIYLYMAMYNNNNNNNNNNNFTMSKALDIEINRRRKSKVRDNRTLKDSTNLWNCLQHIYNSVVICMLDTKFGWN